MNKAFVREPDSDGRVYCPRCGSLATPVNRVTLDHHVPQQFRARLADSAWFCEFATCDVGYFDQFERTVETDDLQTVVYPKHTDAPVCACFGFTLDDIEADVRDGAPTRIRELLKKSQSVDAQCQTLAANGQCCLQEVQRLYLRRISESSA